MGKHANKKALSKYAPFLLVDYIAISRKSQTTAQLLPPYKRAILPGVHALLSLCSEHELEHAYVLLDTHGKHMFKQMHQTFTQNYKYTGAN